MRIENWELRIDRIESQNLWLILRNGYGFPLECRRMYRASPRMGCLFKAVSKRQEFLLAECLSEERNADRQVVSRKSGGHDQIRKSCEVGNVGCRRGRAGRSRLGRRRKQLRAARRRRIHDSIKLL